MLFLSGLVLLIFGSELVVRGSSHVATMLGVSPMFIGLTIVSIGTSTPELAVGLVAGAQGKGGLAVGNIAGTNVLNLLFILGLSALLRPLPMHLQIFKLELPVIVLAAGLMTALAWDGVLSRTDGAIMFAAGVGYTIALVAMTRRASDQAKKEFREEYGSATVTPTKPKWLGQVGSAALLFAGIAFTVAGAELLVGAAVTIAESLGVSPTIIGLTIVAFGTSAPELVTTVISTLKDDRDVAVGNLLGSSIYNILFILSIPCMVSPGAFPVEPQLLWFDIPLMAAVAIGAIPIFTTGRQISRLEGGVGVASYVLYLLWVVFSRV